MVDGGQSEANPQSGEVRPPLFYSFRNDNSNKTHISPRSFPPSQSNVYWLPWRPIFS